MPLTDFQIEVMELLRGRRSESSHFAGGLVLNAPPDSPRYSHDFDMFHDEVVELVRASEADEALLQEAGYEVKRAEKYGAWMENDSFRKMVISKDGEELQLDYAHDSGYRFFPIVEDKILGWRLHLFDMAVNKALALSARSETRDYVDIVELGKRYPLAAICWAACGKDPGFSPLFLLKMMLRFAKIDPAKLDEIKARDLDPIELKKAWLDMADRADAQICELADTYPEIPIGVAFVDAEGEPGWYSDDPTLKPHLTTLRGCWPTFS